MMRTRRLSGTPAASHAMSWAGVTGWVSLQWAARITPNRNMETDRPLRFTLNLRAMARLAGTAGCSEPLMPPLSGGLIGCKITEVMGDPELGQCPDDIAPGSP